MKKTFLAVTALAAFSTGLMADGAALYKKCATCHGAAGEKPALGKSKVINEMSKAEIATALKGYKDGSYGGAQKGMMVAQVKSLDDTSIQAIADHIGK